MDVGNSNLIALWLQSLFSI